jgi:DNA-binding NtrC family response regulator
VKPRQVLLLTSDRELRALLSEAIAEIGAVADVAPDVGDALEKVRGRIRQIDVALIDFQHAAHGMSLLNAVTSCRAGLPVIALIEHGDKQIEALAYATGATRCLRKPLTKYLLTTAIYDLLQSTAYPMAA